MGLGIFPRGTPVQDLGRAAGFVEQAIVNRGGFKQVVRGLRRKVVF